MPCERHSLSMANKGRCRHSRICSPGWIDPPFGGVPINSASESSLGIAIPAQFIDLIHDRLERSFVGVGLMKPAGRKLPFGQQVFERNPPASHTAFDRADRTAANLG